MPTPLRGGDPVAPDAQQIPPDLLAKMERACQIVYEQLFPQLVRYAEVLLSRLSREDGRPSGEDIVQQAFLGLWSKYYACGRLPDPPVEALLYKIIQRRVSDYRKQLKAVRAHEDRAGYVDDVAAAMHNRSSETEQVVGGCLLLADLKKYMHELPEECRRVIELVDFQRLTIQAAAEQLDLTAITARRRRDQGHLLLNERLERGGYRAREQGADGPAGSGT